MVKCNICGSEKTYLFGIIKKEGTITNIYECYECKERTAYRDNKLVDNKQEDKK